MNEPRGIRLLSRRDVQSLLDMRTCIDAVENAFRLHAQGGTISPGVLGTHVPGGGFHVKAAGLRGDRAYYAAKINANFPSNPRERGLPTIQGMIALFDATNGVPLAILDSIEITLLRTAAASAVAAKYLARDDARILTIIGCGAQAPSQLEAIAEVRPLERVMAFDVDASRAEVFSRELSGRLGISVSPASDFRRATRASDIVVTCTPSRKAYLDDDDIPAGAFVAAVGADNEDKQELSPALLGASAVVVDVLDQCANIGELHHALDACAMTRDDVRADLASLVSGAKPGRLDSRERVVFDSTGTALQDVAAAAIVFERAGERGVGIDIALSS